MKPLLMNSVIAVIVAVTGAAAVTRAAPMRGCNFSVQVGNVVDVRTPSTSVKVTKISTSMNISPRIWQKQWDGSVTIAEGNQHKFTFTVDQCTQQHWVRIYYTKKGSDKDRDCLIQSGAYCGI